MSEPPVPPVPPTDPPAQPPAPPAPPVPPAPSTPPAFDPKSLGPEAQAYLAQQIAAADAKARTTSKANAATEAKAELTKKLQELLGQTDAPPDPAALQKTIADLQAGRKAEQLELALMRAALAAGVNADRLTDSRKFMATLKDLDPTDAGTAAALAAAIAEAVKADPGLKASGAPAAPPAGDFTGGTGAPPGTGTGDADSVEAMEKLLYPAPK